MKKRLLATLLVLILMLSLAAPLRHAAFGLSLVASRQTLT